MSRTDAFHDEASPNTRAGPPPSPSTRRAAGRAAVAILATVAVAACTDGARAPTGAASSASVAAGRQDLYPNALASTSWQAFARTLVASHSLSPNAGARAYALLGVAQYAAVVAVGASDGDATLPAQGGGFGAGGRNRFEAERGAVAAASARLLSYLFSDAASVAAINARLDADANAGPGGVHPSFARGAEIGRVAGGDLMVTWAQNDRFTAPFTGTLPAGPGIWYPTGPPVLPMLGQARPFFMTSGSQFHSAPPPAYGSPEFMAAVAEVKALTDARTPQQLALSVFWAFNAGTITPVGHWAEIADALIAEARLDERAAAHVYALAGAATEDAQIGCWETKYTELVMRPWQVDPTISTPLGRPNHPSYPSGHSCASSAYAAVLASFFPSHESELNQLVSDAGMSRVYSGYHYVFDVAAGQILGRSVARLAIAYDAANGLLAAVR